jgi:glycosyltransferase involved in cell wall biosynthesis/SAM-dependent methyltransferase
MPTFNRRAFVPLAIGYFLRQDYPNKELIVVDDGSDNVSDLVPADARIRYFRLPNRHTIGAKRNFACAQAAGEIVVHWDDDDWSAVGRLGYQAGELVAANADICGLQRVLFYAPREAQAWEYLYPRDGRAWVYGASFCYRKAFWKQHPFPDISVGEDSHFLWAVRDIRVHVLPDHNFLVAMVHTANTSAKRTAATNYQPQAAAVVERLLADDLPAYRVGHGRTSPSLWPASRAIPRAPVPAAPVSSSDCGLLAGGVPVPLDLNPRERTQPMDPMTIARKADLSLREFTAFNHNHNLPLMRRWELPFALFQARLGNNMSVLDCTINPVNFREQLLRLYPHTLYRHHNPIQDGRFVLPAGIPDEAFDRVVCVNSLEHLLKPQRQDLLTALARKLKPGGLLVLTSDYYFDSSWRNPAFLQAGVMRADRQEMFNGWNKVTPAEWLEMCGRNGLHPLSHGPAEPREDDGTLYLNAAPHAHATLGGVFSKGPRAELPPSRKIVLALLTWNTWPVSRDSVQAYLDEAAMLVRLGHQPFLCVCDNGSTDGTVPGLRALEGKLPIPHRFIFNPHNRGNSTARNQIIDCACAADADYILFMDGDIEVVPFSSFAMLRYMEDFGGQLGCIGADSYGQTPNRAGASLSWYAIGGCRLETTNLVAWTQYGMFRRKLFEDGVRFDETAPFDRAGWGFEDNDLAFQMEVKGYVNQRFFGMVYLHRNARSSIRIMRQQGIDPNSLYDQRKKYVLDKWAATPAISNGPLVYVKAANIQV